MRLVITAVADPDPSIRMEVLSSFDSGFDEYLGRSENLTRFVWCLGSREPS